MADGSPASESADDDGTIPPPAALPDPPRELTPNQLRSCWLGVVVGGLLLVGLPALTPVLVLETFADHRKERTWRTGQRIAGLVTRKERVGPLGRHELDIAHRHGGKRFVRTHVIPRDEEYAAFRVGQQVQLRVDPAAPELGVIAREADALQLWQLPLLVLAVLGFTLMGFFMLRAGWRKLRIAPRGAAVPFEVVKPLSLGLARVRYRWGERAHTGVIELGPRLVHRDDTALLIDPDNPRRCCGARVHEFARELDVVAAERRLRGLVERWLDISLDDPPADDEAPSDDPAIRARALIAWIDATLAADANLARSFEQWITAPQRRLELEHDDALALEQLVAFRRVRRHVRHRFVIGTAGFTALAMGVAQALIFDGPFALMVGISFVLLTLVLWALMPR